MLEFRIVYVLFGCLYIVSTEGSSIRVRKERGVAEDWGYNIDNGPSTWGGVCKKGSNQSPINIVLGDTIVKNYPSFGFDESYLSRHRFVAKNNGHTVYVTLEDESVKPIIYGGGLENKFIFEQLHFHWESEHEFDGKRGDLEMHVVHYNSKYQSYEEASKKPDGIVVLAVIFNESEEIDGVIEDFLGYILEQSAPTHGYPSPPPTLDNQVRGAEMLGTTGFYALRDLLPKHVTRFFRYAGSLTTPGCGEVVQWTIFINRFPVSSKALELFRQLQDKKGIALSQNYRPPQSLNGREVYIQIRNYDGRLTSEFEQLAHNSTSGRPMASISVMCGLILLTRFN